VTVAAPTLPVIRGDRPGAAAMFDNLRLGAARAARRRFTPRDAAIDLQARWRDLGLEAALQFARCSWSDWHGETATELRQLIRELRTTGKLGEA